MCVHVYRCMDSIRLPFLSNFHVIDVLLCDAFLYFFALFGGCFLLLLTCLVLCASLQPNSCP